MRVANLNGRATIVTDAGLIDVERASNGAFTHDVDRLISCIDDLAAWFETTSPSVTESLRPQEVLRDPHLGPVVTTPSQIFAIGVNYRAHAAEMGLTPPVTPMVFTKFASALAGANAIIPVPSSSTDWEAELVVVVGKRGRHIPVETALSYVAGYCVGQDFSDRDLQLRGTPAQFSLGKSHKNFAPVGPWITTRDEIADPNDLRVTCDVNGHRFQDSTTGDMVFSVPELIAYLSSICELQPGDLIFTGSPHGVGQGQHPPVFLKSGDLIETAISGLGSIRNVAYDK
ncbi:MAG: fumarylacetoacetate hydrolase family protein [Acidobacteria bacterium]|nr:fumarylacetoacetate hydrolase family protein [Acidobacteriota bacterium]